jgi:hypothetical protein
MYKLFFTAFAQVALVAMNVNFIANGYIIPMLLTGFGISFIWTLNVRKVAFGTLQDRLIYSFGAMVGTGVGYYLSHYLTLLTQ